jgi:hypothetical protein
MLLAHGALVLLMSTTLISKGPLTGSSAAMAAPMLALAVRKLDRRIVNV